MYAVGLTQFHNFPVIFSNTGWASSNFQMDFDIITRL